MKLQKNFLGILVLIVCIAVAVFLMSDKKQPKVCIKSSCFNVELALTPGQRGRGLMFRQNLDSRAGMLFAFEEEGNYSFWMKNTQIPLDIIWISSENKIVSISENAQPCQKEDCPTINPSITAMYVLEINAGLSSSGGITIGDKVLFKNFKPLD